MKRKRKMGNFAHPLHNMCVLEIRFIPRRNTNLGEVLIDEGLDRESEEITGAD